MMETEGRQRNPPTLLLGLLIGAALWGKVYIFSLKNNNRVTIWSKNLPPRHLSRENSNSKYTCTPVFIAAYLQYQTHGSSLNVHQQKKG